MSTFTTDSQGSSASNIRHDLLTPINHLLGYTEMMLEDCEEQGLDSLLESLGRVRATSKELQAAIERVLPSSPAPAARSELGMLQTELRGPMAQMFQIIENVERDIAVIGKPNLLSDFASIRVAAERLNQHLQELPAGDPAPVAPVVIAPVVFAPVAAAPVVVAPVVVAPVVVAPVVEPSASVAVSGLTTPATRGHKSAITGRILVVDDDASNRDVLCRRLEREGHETCAAVDGDEALRLLSGQPFDMVLLDFMMPGKTGSEVLAVIKSNPALCHIPVIMISAADDLARVVQCIELGAEDYLSKPFDPVLLRARIGASLEKKRLRDEEQRKSEQLAVALREAENQKGIADSLLRDILPETIAQELLAKGSVDPKYFEDVTIVFTDFVGFTASTESIAAEDLVMSLHEYFTAFDQIVQRYGLEKLKTIGDSYMLAGGLPVRSSSNPVDAVLACLEFLRVTDELGKREGAPGWKVRVGAHTGPVIAGVVGIRKFAFDVWGETVNFASRMESSGMPGRINISGSTYSRVKDFFECEPRGKVLTKEKREYDMYFVNGISPRLLGGAAPPGALRAPGSFVRRYGIYFQKEPLAFPGFLLDALPERVS